MLNRSLKLSKRMYHANASDFLKPTTLGSLVYGKDSMQYKVLSHAMDVSVPIYGFNERAIVHSLNVLKLPSSMLSVISSSNPPSFLHSSPALMELIKFHLVDKRYKTVAGIDPEAADEELPSLESLLLKRLKLNAPIASRLSQVLSQLAIPGPFLLNNALPELHRLSDDLLYFSNEKDHTDFAWYSKRLAISCTYVSSELFMSQDKSADFSQTFEFAQEKLHRVMKLGEYYNNTEEFTWYTMLSAVNLAKSQLARG
ncbi:hypothetical protein HG535_0E05160 [Zygotorulaspora mrakii]|uniref:Ubiquinone biosynthesis protein n=1 Tax=Zygotorulaspora mrakii TaxID=42260 RepID=A0A7H9B6L7_ZYGMR|nr:uncharacterized protein HG535_0E05160 [Zygotorulaspora mrakii]QLG73432.1 hypothetical protein HG535_0E05160 [Zygotorulaspora mrakii]